MNWLPHLSNGYLALAGLICAAGPVVIHLLNRRRFRQVEWAAMGFLLEALTRQRRRLLLRDLLLLVLRTAAVFLFGLALARPFLTGDGSSIDAHSPRHLILLLDNSLSMGYRQVNETLLERAKDEARKLIESLPEGSQITLLFTCGRVDDGRGPLRRKSDALDLLETVEVADGVSTIGHVISMARTVLATAAPLTDQIVLLTDLQRSNWPAESAADPPAQLPPLNIRDVSARPWDNAWVADVRLRDDIVDLDAPATVFVTICHRGTEPRRTQVTLAIDEQVIASRSIEFPPGPSERQLTFECSFAETAVEPGAVAFVPLCAAITPDRLALDDQRTVMIPVVASLPVVFVDHVRESDEDPALRRLGETRPLRQLLASSTIRTGQRPLVDIQHVTVDQLSRALLSTARLVVVAGVPDPSPGVDLLREYVQQGGPLLIATGADFDPVAWNAAAWRGGNGILPGRLVETPVGITPEEAVDTVIEPFSLSWESLQSEPLLRIPGLSAEELQDLYREPLFFRFVAVEPPVPADQAVENSESSGAARLAEPQWLAWQAPAPETDIPGDNFGRVCGRFDDAQHSPFLLAKRVGIGQILFTTTGFLPSWNNVAQTNSIVLWDHILRTLLRSTLPHRNYTPQRQLAIPLPVRARGAKVRLQRPQSSGPDNVLDVGFIGEDRLGVTIVDAWTRGLYRLQSAAGDDESDKLELRGWRETIALNGDAGESDLTPLTDDEFQKQVLDTHVGQLVTGDTLSAVDHSAHGSPFWWWLVLTVLVLLIVELILLATPTWKWPSAGDA